MWDDAASPIEAWLIHDTLLCRFALIFALPLCPSNCIAQYIHQQGHDYDWRDPSDDQVSTVYRRWEENRKRLNAKYFVSLSTHLIFFLQSYPPSYIAQNPIHLGCYALSNQWLQWDLVECQRGNIKIIPRSPSPTSQLVSSLASTSLSKLVVGNLASRLARRDWFWICFGGVYYNADVSDRDVPTTLAQLYFYTCHSSQGMCLSEGLCSSEWECSQDVCTTKVMCSFDRVEIFSRYVHERVVCLAPKWVHPSPCT